ncbi:MAG TPA: conjugal transfer protein TrbL family protein [Symbiobacteriaceae bacterium]|nr:conjugal transfer protein TrbL family protein [Symbiobacteriaceae bacterium]
MGSWVQQTAWGIVLFILHQLTGEWSNIAWEWFSRLFSSPLAVIDHPLVERLVQVAVGLVLGFLPVVIAATVIKETVARLDGTSNTPPEALIRRALVTGIAVTGTSTAAWFMSTLADHARGILGAAGLDINLLSYLFTPPGTAGLTLVVLSLTFLVGAILVAIQGTVIAAEFTLLLIIGPIMAVGLIREGGTSTWTVWLREVGSLLITKLIQLLVVLVFLRIFTGNGGKPDPLQQLASLAFLYVLWNAPRWSRQLVYRTGTSGALVGAAAGAGRMVVMRQLMRIVTKV